jgi:hypothetical protein
MEEEIEVVDGPMTRRGGWYGSSTSQWVDAKVQYEDFPPPELDTKYNKFQIFLKPFTQQTDTTLNTEEKDKATTYIISYVLDEALDKIYASNCCFVEGNGEIEPLSDKQEKGLLVLAQLLHRPILESFWTKNPDDFMMPQEFLQFYKQQQHSLLARFCYTLTTVAVLIILHHRGLQC